MFVFSTCEVVLFMKGLKSFERRVMSRLISVSMLDPIKWQSHLNKIIAFFSGCLCRSVQSDRLPSLPDSGAEWQCVGWTEETVWSQSRACASDTGAALVHFSVIPVASGIVPLQVAQQLIPAEISGSSAARTRCIVALDLSPRCLGCLAPCSPAILESCGGICILECDSSDTKPCWSYVGSVKLFLLMGKNSNSLTLFTWRVETECSTFFCLSCVLHWLLQRSTGWDETPGLQSFVVKGNI